MAAQQAGFLYPGRCHGIGPFDVQIGCGEMHVFSGPSGCGKTTLVRMLSGLIPHLYRGRLSGRVLVGNCDTRDLPLWKIAAGVGLATQNPPAQLLTSSVRAEIEFGLENIDLSAGEIETRVGQALETFGLEELAWRDPHTLSGGEQQKTVLAAITARRPEVLILDEPLSMIDTASAKRIVDHLGNLRRAGAAVVVTEHRRSSFLRLENVHWCELPAFEPKPIDLPGFETEVPAFQLRADDLYVELGGCKALDGVDLTIEGGQVISVVGPNGAGKTTLLRTLSGLQSYSGRIAMSMHGDRARPRLGMCFQNPDRQLFNASLRAEILFNIKRYDERFYCNVIELLGLAPYEDCPPLLLSEGQKKRLALAIMLMQPDLCGVCLDEPTLGQDEQNCNLLGQIVRRLASAGYLCLIATHNLDWAARWSDQVVGLQSGRVVAWEDLHESEPLRDSPLEMRSRAEIWPELNEGEPGSP